MPEGRLVTMDAADPRSAGRGSIEPALEPDLPICDSHHHFWTHRGRYLVDEYLRDLDCGHRVVSTVFVTAHVMVRGGGPMELLPVGETDFVEALVSAARPEGSPDLARGIVAYADLTLGEDVRPVLEAHRAASPRRFCGIRHTVTWDPDPTIRNAAPHPRPGVLLEPAFQQGAACLASMDLAFDAFLFHHQLPDLVAFAAALPQLTIVLNHIGTPLGTHGYATRRAAVVDEWKRDIERLARCPNVNVKVGGFGMQRLGLGWERREAPVRSSDVAAVIAPYFDFCVDHFGVERCMFESNFPVDKEGLDYGVLWNAFKLASERLNTRQRAALFHDTAVRVYRLNERAAPASLGGATSPTHSE